MEIALAMEGMARQDGPESTGYLRPAMVNWSANAQVTILLVGTNPAGP